MGERRLRLGRRRVASFCSGASRATASPSGSPAARAARERRSGRCRLRQRRAPLRGSTSRRRRPPRSRRWTRRAGWRGRRGGSLEKGGEAAAVVAEERGERAAGGALGDGVERPLAGRLACRAPSSSGRTPINAAASSTASVPTPARRPPTIHQRLSRRRVRAAAAAALAARRRAETLPSVSGLVRSGPAVAPRAAARGGRRDDRRAPSPTPSA